MPQWRKLHLKTVESLDINDMPDDFIRLTWVLLPLGLDSEGRGLDNPAWIKSHIFPLRTDVSLSMIEGAIQWFTERHMIHRYEVDGRHYFCIPTFHKYQGNTSREASSQYPAPPGPKPPQEEEQHDNGNGPDINEDNSRVTHELLTSKSSTDSDSDVDIDTDKSIPKGIDGEKAPLPESQPVLDQPLEKPPEPENTPAQALSELLPDTEYSRLLFEKLKTEYAAKGRHPPGKFPSLACKRKFDARAGFLKEHTGEAVDRALQKGILAVVGVTDFIAKWEPTREREQNNNGHGSKLSKGLSDTIKSIGHG